MSATSPSEHCSWHRRSGLACPPLRQFGPARWRWRRRGPIAIIGVVIDWAVLHIMFPVKVEAMDVPARHAPRQLRLVKPAIVVAGVITGFLIGFPPALVAAVGAAVILISRSMEPRLV